MFPTFLGEEFDDSVILEATSNDLAALGLTMGAQKKILSAIQQIKTGQVYKCSICDKQHYNLENLMRHYSVVHNMGPKNKILCLHCRSSYVRNSYYNHMRGFFNWHKPIDLIVPANNEAIIDYVEEEEAIDEFHKISDLEMQVLRFACSLLATGKLPISTYEKIISEVQLVFSSVLDNCSNYCKQISANADEIDKAVDAILDHKSIFNAVKNKYNVDKRLHELKLLTIPKEIVLDTDLISKNKGMVSTQVYKKCAMHYASIRTTLEKILINCDLKNFGPKTVNIDKVYKYFGDGSLFKSKFQMLDSHKVFINIYYDDIEVVNPLGTKTGTHKLAQFYFSIVDLPGSLNSSPQNMFFLASVKSADMKSSGSNAVMKPIIDELKELSEVGIIIQDKLLHVYLCQIVGDNLGLHTLLGFSEGFTANYPCRRCKMHRNECHEKVKEDLSKLRTMTNYRTDLNVDSLSSTGLKFESILNELPYFHVTHNVSFDIMHDLLGGVVPDFLRHMLNRLIEEKLTDLNQINHRIESFNYGPHYSKTKPTFFKAGFLKGEVLSNQYSSQVSCLLICLPFIIGDLIPEGYVIWEMFILLREIYNLLMSVTITEGQIIELDSYISEFLTCYKAVFNLHLKPKHHHLLHYGESIRKIGPLKQFWSMIHEARHKFFKNVLNAAGNFKNVPKTISYRYQLSLAYRLLSTDNIFSQDIKIHDSNIIESFDTVHANIIRPFLKLSEQALIETMDRITMNNNEYKIGSIVVYKLKELVLFGKIVKIFKHGTDICFIVGKVNFCYSNHFMAFEIDVTENLECINVNLLAYYLPLYSMITFNDDNKKYVSLATRI